MCGQIRALRRAAVSRWVARILGTALFVLFAKQGWFEIQHLFGRQGFPDHVFSAGLVAMLAGVALAWFLEGAGGAVILVGYVLATVPAIALALAGARDVWILVIALVPFLVTGLLFRRARALSRRDS